MSSSCYSTDFLDELHLTLLNCDQNHKWQVSLVRGMPFLTTSSIPLSSHPVTAETPFVGFQEYSRCRSDQFHLVSFPFPITHHSHYRIYPIKILKPFSIMSFPSAFKKPAQHVVLQPKLFISLKLTTGKIPGTIQFLRKLDSEASKSISLAFIYCVFRVYSTYPISFNPNNPIKYIIGRKLTRVK